MDIVVRGRNVEVPDHYRQHVAEKLARVERYNDRIIRADVELLHEKNPRQAEVCQRVEITCRVRGPVVRIEACAADFYKALDIATERLERKFRQAADRRRVHHGRHTPTSVAAATSALVDAGTSPVAVAEPATEDDRPGAVRDGTRRARLLSVRRLRHRPGERGLPSPRLRLRRDPPCRVSECRSERGAERMASTGRSPR